MFHRKSIVIIILLVTMVMANTTPARAQIANHMVINEFELNPAGDDSTPGAQFVEIYNPTSISINIAEWKVSTTHSTVTWAIPVEAPCCGATYIPAKGFYEIYTFGLLAKEDESIILRDVAGKEIDRTPVKSDSYDDARTWQRNPDGSDNWVFQTYTRGLQNIPEFPSASIILAVTLLTALIILRNQKKLITKKIDGFTSK